MKQLFQLIVITALGLMLSLSIHLLSPVGASLPVQNQGLALMQVGKKHYDLGQFSDAAQVWQQAVQAYEAAGDVLNQALASSFLSLAAQQLGQWEEAKEAIDASLSWLKTLPSSDRQVRAQVLNTQGRLQLVRGKAEAALKTWQKAEVLYEQAGDPVGALGSQINQTLAMQSLGLYRRARKLFSQIEQKLRKQPASRLKVTGLRTLGNLWRQAGELEKSKEILEQALAVAVELGLNQQKSATLLSLGNTARAQKNPSAALNFYEQAETVAADRFSLLRIQAQLNQLGLLIEVQQWSKAESLRQKIPDPLEALPPSRPAVYAQVNLAKNLISLKLKNRTLACPIAEETENQPSSRNETADEPCPPAAAPEVIQLLNAAVQKAEALQEQRGKSYALGHLGQLYEESGEWQKAKEYTEKALKEAQQIQASDIAYQWQWQLGRLLRNENVEAAIAAYSQAVNSLQTLRGDLVTLNPDIQFDFRKEVEPVYRQLVDLLLQPTKPSQAHLQQAREVIEALQLAELNNFFQEACLDAQPQQIDQIDLNAAVIYSIILPERLAVILSLPGQRLRYYATALAPTPDEGGAAHKGRFLTIDSVRDGETRRQGGAQFRSFLEMQGAPKDKEDKGDKGDKGATSLSSPAPSASSAHLNLKSKNLPLKVLPLSPSV